MDLNTKFMKPFNLEQALAGKPFTNAKGWTVEDWHYFKTSIERPISIKFAELGHTTNWAEFELFMLPEKKKVWIVVYKKGCNVASATFNCEADAIGNAEYRKERNEYIKTIETEYEL